MCAIIGVTLESPTLEDFEMIKRVFLESKIRGMHATGLSYVKNNEVVTEKYPVPADQFPFNFKDYVNEDGNLYLVGHCRYSTSDLEFNQPIASQSISVVHNGVITQESPNNWKGLYNYNCETKNDTELILRTLEKGLSPLEVWSDSSLAVCELYADKKLRAYRNGKRPIYLTALDNGVLFTSTKDIPHRAGIDATTTELKPYTYAIGIDPMTVEFVLERKPENFKDLQHEASCY